MKTHSETLQLPFGSAILRVTTNGAIIASHEFTELPLERVFEDLGEEHLVAACFLGGLRVHLDPGELLLTDMEIDVGEDWEGEQSYGMNCTTLSAWNSEGTSLAIGMCNNEWFTTHDPGLELIEKDDVQFLCATHAAIVPVLISVAASIGQVPSRRSGLLSVGYDPQEPIDACGRVVNYALTEWLGKRHQEY